MSPLLKLPCCASRQMFFFFWTAVSVVCIWVSFTLALWWVWKYNFPVIFLHMYQSGTVHNLSKKHAAQLWSQLMTRCRYLGLEGWNVKKRKRIITYMGGVMKMAQWNLNILQVYVRYSRGSSAVWTVLSKKREKEPWSFFIWEILENVTISSISQEKYCTSAGVKESWDLEKFASVYV